MGNVKLAELVLNTMLKDSGIFLKKNSRVSIQSLTVQKNYFKKV